MSSYNIVMARPQKKQHPRAGVSLYYINQILNRHARGVWFLLPFIAAVDTSIHLHGRQVSDRPTHGFDRHPNEAVGNLRGWQHAVGGGGGATREIGDSDDDRTFEAGREKLDANLGARQAHRRRPQE